MGQWVEARIWEEGSGWEEVLCTGVAPSRKILLFWKLHPLPFAGLLCFCAACWLSRAAGLVAKAV